MNGNDTFLDIRDAHLRVTSGNVYASTFNLDQIDIVMSSNTASTVNFNNPTKAFNTVSNIEVGTANLFVDTTTTRVGVGTNAPAYTLDVHGSANVGVITATDINVTGNLAVLGTSTIVDTDNLRVKDPIIELGKDNTASPPVVDLGLVMTRPSGSSNVGIIFDESTDTLEIGYTQGSASDTDITMRTAATEPLDVSVNGNVSVGKELTVSGNVEVGTANLFVDTVNSRVGIGTTNPDARLHLEEPSAISATTRLFHTENAFAGGSVGHFEIIEEKTGAGIGWGDFTLRLQRRVDVTEQGYIEFNPSGSTGDYGIAFGNSGGGGPGEIMRIVGQSGNVGIGTTSPSSVFNTFGGALWDGSSMASKVCATLEVGRGGGIGAAANDTGFGGILEFRHDSDSRFVTIESVSEAAYSASIGLRFKTHGGTGDGERMRIDGAGNVGIGTTSPSHALTVAAASGDAEVHIQAQGNDGGDAILYFNGSPTNQRKCAIISSNVAPNSYCKQDLHFCMETTNDLSDVDITDSKMVITNTGNVGIGTTSPDCNLEIYGDTSSIKVTRSRNNTNYGTNISFALLNSANEKFTYGRVGGSIADNTDGSEDGFLSFQVATNGNLRDNYEEEKMRITSAGNVGIGTTTAESSLEVHGTGIHINGTVLRSYSGMGAMTAGQWYKVCDFSALPATVSGVCAIRIKWGGGTLTNVGTYYWTGYASGIVSYNTYGDGNGTYSAAPSEPLTLTQHYHHRAAGAFEFVLDGDNSGGSYGRQSIYMKTPQSLSALSLEVIAMPLRR